MWLLRPGDVDTADGMGGLGAALGETLLGWGCGHQECRVLVQEAPPVLTFPILALGLVTTCAIPSSWRSPHSHCHEGRTNPHQIPCSTSHRTAQ